MVLSLNWIGQVDLILTCIHLAIFLEKKNSWLHVKNKVADENLHSQRQINFRVKLQCLVLELLFISYFDFRKQSEEFFFSKQKNSSNENRSVQDPQDVQFPVGLVQNKRKCEVRKFSASCLVLLQLLQDTQTYTVRPNYCSELPFIIFTYTPTRPI